MVGVIDYGLGNVQAFLSVYKALGIKAMAIRTPDEVAQASSLILPGVGSFDWAMQRLLGSGMREPLEDAATLHRRPILGVCVGMQMLGTSSEEGVLPGLSWLDAEVTRLLPGEERVRLPHMGWNDVTPTRSDGLFEGLQSARFYFLHSYCIRLGDRQDEVATTYYGQSIPAAVRRGNVCGVQFHPEKSHSWGMRLLKNFAEL